MSVSRCELHRTEKKSKRKKRRCKPCFTIGHHVARVFYNTVVTTILLVLESCPGTNLPRCQPRTATPSQARPHRRFHRRKRSRAAARASCPLRGRAPSVCIGDMSPSASVGARACQRLRWMSCRKWTMVPWRRVPWPTGRATGRDVWKNSECLRNRAGEGRLMGGDDPPIKH
jgi:hypothetical protein